MFDKNLSYFIYIYMTKPSTSIIWKMILFLKNSILVILVIRYYVFVIF